MSQAISDPWIHAGTIPLDPFVASESSRLGFIDLFHRAAGIKINYSAHKETPLISGDSGLIILSQIAEH